MLLHYNVNNYRFRKRRKKVLNKKTGIRKDETTEWIKEGGLRFIQSPSLY